MVLRATCLSRLCSRAVHRNMNGVIQTTIHGGLHVEFPAPRGAKMANEALDL